MNSSLAYGSKDLLLVKCKQMIEELRIELEQEKKLKQQCDETAVKLERDCLDRDSKIRDLEYREEKNLSK